MVWKVFINTANLCGTAQNTVSISSSKCKGMHWRTKKNCYYEQQMTQEERDTGMLSEHGKSWKIKFI